MHRAFEIRTHSQLVQLLTVATQQDKPREVAAMIIEQDSLKAVDYSLFLQLAIALIASSEELEGLLLVARVCKTESDKKCSICHDSPPTTFVEK